MKLNEAKLRARVAELLLQRACRLEGFAVADELLRVAVDCEQGRPIYVEGAVCAAVTLAAQDIAGMGHYEEARRLLEAR